MTTAEGKEMRRKSLLFRALAHSLTLVHEDAGRELNRRKTFRACGLTPFGQSGTATPRVQ
ncbi:hypothetical protein [Halorhabdus salina]|uniref:hypothetical protein n=1 Tax=Halorhabdus salina TaxID=2750670 RepID=UPI0015EE9E7F|nr:hypothetical protein [Halorhabdus salina]